LNYSIPEKVYVLPVLVCQIH